MLVYMKLNTSRIKHNLTSFDPYIIILINQAWSQKRVNKTFMKVKMIQNFRQNGTMNIALFAVAIEQSPEYFKWSIPISFSIR